MFRKVLTTAMVLAVSVLPVSLCAQDAKTPEKSRFEKLELFNKVLYLIESQYYREIDTDKLIQGAIRGMMNTLDPHSQFLEPDVFSKMQEDTKGEFGGLGIEVSQKDGTIVVITPIEDTPAFRAGVKPGDRIVEINHESTIGLSLEEAVDKMRGKPKSKVIMGILRDGEEGVKQIELMREVIKIDAVKSALIEDRYIWVRLTQFQQHSADQISEAIKKHRKTADKNGGLLGIVLDLRSNPGGLLDEAVNVSSIFMKDGIVVSTEGRDPKQKEIRYVRKTGYKEVDIPLVVLINGSSASASEIVAGALQDSKRGIILGTQSFGKGSVQNLIRIDDAQGVKLTIAQYMTPLSRKIQAIGITPDIVIDEYEASWTEDNKREPRYLREVDLKNHLTATVETAEEKKAREQKEREDRQNRLAEIKKIREQKKKKSDEAPKTYTPQEDYQVLQSVKYLKSFQIYSERQK
jgi:carboxyl-terminal processing protease